MANHADGLTDIDLNSYVDEFLGGEATAKFLAVTPPSTFHALKLLVQ